MLGSACARRERREEPERRRADGSIPGGPGSPSRPAAWNHAPAGARAASRALWLGRARAAHPDPLLHQRTQLRLEPRLPAPPALGAEAGRRTLLAWRERRVGLRAGLPDADLERPSIIRRSRR